MTPVFSKLVFKTLVVILNYKKSNWFYFLYWHGLRSIKQLQCLRWQNTELFGKYIFRRSHPELFFENVATFGKHMCWSLLFSKVAGWKPPTLFKKTLAHVLSCDFCKILRNTCLVKHLQIAASVYCQRNFNMEKNLLVPNLLLICFSYIRVKNKRNAFNLFANSRKNL